MVDVVALYRTVRPSSVPSAASLAGCDMLTFTSSSTVTNFAELFGKDADDLLRYGRVAAIGPITAETLRARGIEPDVVPKDYTIDGLVAAICDYFANRESVK
jgi:uroporphyrinogen III methyltransferase/synthase